MNHLLKNKIVGDKSFNNIAFWMPSDTQDLWRRNSKKYPELMTELGWTEDNVFYKFDKYGFRNDENFDKAKHYNLVLGCSHTFGIGVRNEHVWYNHLKSKFPEPFYNAAIPGGSIGGCVRSLMGLQSEGMKIKRVFALIPDRTRYDVFWDTGENWEVVSWWTDHPKDLTKWILAEQTLLMFYNTNRLALKQLCQQSNIEFVDIAVDSGDDVDVRICEDRKARDLMHPGVKTHKWLGAKFYDEYCKRYGSST